MATPTTKTNVIVSAAGGGNVLLDTAVTDGGSGGHFEVRIDMPELDQVTTLSLSAGFTNLTTTGKLFPEATGDISGSYTENDHWSVGVKFGFCSRGDFSTTESGRPWFALRSCSQSGISIGQMTLRSPGGTVGGTNYPGDEETWTTLKLSKETSWGFEFWPTNDFIIMPEVGFIMSATHVFTGDKEFQEWPLSTQEIAAFIRLNFGYGTAGHKVTKSDDLTDVQMATYFAKESQEIAYASILSAGFSQPQIEGEGLVNDVLSGGSEGLSGGRMWLVPSLQGLSRELGASGGMKAVTYHIKAPSLAAKIPGLVLELGKGVGYAAANSGDPELLVSGITAFNNLVTIAMFEAGIPEAYLPLIPFVIGGLELAFSGLTEDGSVVGGGLRGGGISTALQATGGPDMGRETLVEATSYSYLPVVYNMGNISGLAGEFSIRKHMVDSLFYTEMSLISPALMLTNFGNLGINSAQPYNQENSYKDAETPNFVISTVGVEELFDFGAAYLNLSGGVSLIEQIDAVSAKGGAGISVNALLGIWFDEDEKKKAFEFGVKMMAYKTFGDGGFIIGPSLAIRTGD
jgi:hypothetical protein